MLTYDTLIQKTMDTIPAVKTKYDILIAHDIIDVNAGKHIIFSYAFVPILINAIKSGDAQLTKSMMQFVEDMASSDDHLVVEVCDYSILEALNDEIDETVLLPLMGEKTRVGFNAVKKYML